MFVNPLPKDMAGGATGLEVMLSVQDGAELADFKGLGGRANLQGPINFNPRSVGCRGSDHSPTMQIRGALSMKKATI